MGLKFKIDSRILVGLLAQRHSADIFVPELNVAAGRLDGWALKKSYIHPCISGYEIKVDRGDFNHDKKWPGYLSYCNEFYFVCPPNLIRPNEIPEGVGLLWCSSTGTRLYCKKKAVWRNVEEGKLSEAYLSIILNRAVIRDQKVKESQLDFWKKWLQERDEKKEIGYQVSAKIRQLVSERISEVNRENGRLKRENDEYARIKEWMEKNGIGTRYPSLYSVRAKVAEAKQVVPLQLIALLGQMSTNLKTLQENLKEFVE